MRCILMLLASLSWVHLFAQGGGGLGFVIRPVLPVATTLPILVLNTEPRSSGAGEISVAAPTDNQPAHLLTNPSLLVNRGNGWGISFGYAPWLRSLINDVYVFDHNFYYNFKDKNSLSVTYRYLSLGEVQVTNIQGEVTGGFHSREMVTQLRYARMLSKHFSVGGAAKYIFSSINGPTWQTVAGLDVHPVNSFAMDVGADYRTTAKLTEKAEYRLNAGISMMNLGPKVTYTVASEKDFIPANLNLGVVNTFKVSLGDSGSYVQCNIGYQADKLMTPTPTPDDRDSNRVYDYREQPYFKGLFTSFSDAPGGVSEELREFVHHIGGGVEYVCKRRIMVNANAGVVLEDEQRGRRRYTTWSVGLGGYGFFFDVAFNHPFDKETDLVSFKLNAGYTTTLGGRKTRKYFS